MQSRFNDNNTYCASGNSLNGSQGEEMSYGLLYSDDLYVRGLNVQILWNVLCAVVLLCALSVYAIKPALIASMMPWLAPVVLGAFIQLLGTCYGILNDILACKNNIDYFVEGHQPGQDGGLIRHGMTERARNKSKSIMLNAIAWGHWATIGCVLPAAIIYATLTVFIPMKTFSVLLLVAITGGVLLCGEIASFFATNLSKSSWTGNGWRNEVGYVMLQIGAIVTLIINRYVILPPVMLSKPVIMALGSLLPLFYLAMLTVWSIEINELKIILESDAASKQPANLHGGVRAGNAERNVHQAGAEEKGDDLNIDTGDLIPERNCKWIGIRYY